MKIIEKDSKQEKAEDSQKKKEERYRKLMEDGGESDYGKEVIKILDEELETTENSINNIQVEEMKNVFLLTKKEQEAKIKIMSNRHLILTGVRDIILNLKSRL